MTKNSLAVHFSLATLSGMKLFRLSRSQTRKVGWLLVASVLFLTLLPAHFHIHHSDKGHDHAAHHHVVDLHLDRVTTDEAHHQDAAVLKASPDSVVKTSVIKLLPFLILGMLFTFVVYPGYRFIKKPARYNFAPAGRRGHYSPPLRGPPI